MSPCCAKLSRVFWDEVRIGGRVFGGHGLLAFLMRGMREK
jgi:hypothetical protein